MLFCGNSLRRTAFRGFVLWNCLLLGMANALIPMGRTQEISEGEEDLDDLLSEFDDNPVVELEKASVPISKSWEIDGFVRSDFSYSIARGSPDPGEPDYQGISRLQSTLQLELPVKFSGNWNGFVSGQAFHDFSYGLNDRENYTQALLDLYENEAEIREAYLSGSPWPWLDIKLGRQIIVWGAADYIRVVDVLNPLDNRQPALVDLEDLRLPVTMSRVDLSMNRWTLSGVTVHEIDFGKNPVFNGQFFPLPLPAPREIVPSDSLSNTEFAVSLTGSFTGWDLGVYWADYYDDAPHFETRGLDFGLHHSHLSMTGVAVNGVVGNWLWKSEAGLVRGLEFNNLPTENLSRLDGLVGIEYSGISDTTLSLEVVNRHLLSFSPVLKAIPDRANENFTQYNFAYLSSFLRDRLHLTALFSVFGGGFEQGRFQRLSAAYDFSDGFTVTGGILLFQGGATGGVLDAYDNNDLLFMQAKYSF
jgi:hypothetical protein